MIPLPKLYPDLWRPRLGYLFADLVCLLWIALWLYIGDAVYRAVMTLSVIANGVIATGQAMNAAVADVQQRIDDVPLIGGNLHGLLTPLHNIPNGLIDQGQQELAAIHHLALLLGIGVAAIPVFVTLLRYLTWRARKTRGFRNLDRMLRRPGAKAVSTTMQVLAGRALYTLPYDQLLSYSPDPIAEWREGRHYNLARATMAEEGLDLRRYLRRMEGLASLPEPVDAPLIRDE